MDLFEASMVYKTSSRTTRDVKQRNLEQQQQKHLKFSGFLKTEFCCIALTDLKLTAVLLPLHLRMIFLILKLWFYLEVIRHNY